MVDQMARSATGVLLGESLRVGTTLEMPLVIEKISRADVGEPSAGQPSIWTLLHFRIPESIANDLADRLAETLEAEGGWYCDFATQGEKFVVFSGRIFRYQRGDSSSRERAAEYARSVGVPEEQIDWPE
jgi:hypothetical protein